MLLCIALGGLVVKLGQLYAVDADRYASLAQNQRIRSRDLPATRGAILDREGQPLVTSVIKKTIWADPLLVTDAAGGAALLAPVLGLDVAILTTRLSSDNRFVYLARQVERDVSDAVAKLELKGIFVIDESAREKPAGVAGSVVGLVDTDNAGTAGIELQFDDVLAGTPGKIEHEESRDGHTIPSGEHRVIDPKPGSDVVLTIDRNLQYSVEEVLAAGVERFGARHGSAVVMDPSNGEVLALANAERTTLPDGGSGPVAATFYNLAVSATFEVGSVLKPVTMAGAMEQANLAPNDVIHVPAVLQVADEVFRDSGRFADADLSVSDILRVSSNLGTMRIAQMSGEEVVSDYLDRFGFGRVTGLEVPNEEPGTVPRLDDWSGTSLPTLAIGHGLSVTPIQIAAAYSAIANGGELVAPTLLKATVDPDGVNREAPGRERTRIISEETAAGLRSMLRAVVTDGTGKLADVAGYEVAGKTGTAWKVRADVGYGDAGNRSYVATFAGMVPADNPRFVIVVVIDEPSAAVYTGGGAAAPVFADIAHPALVSLGVRPQHRGDAAQADVDPPPAGRVRAQRATLEDRAPLPSLEDGILLVTGPDGRPVPLAAPAAHASAPSSPAKQAIVGPVTADDVVADPAPDAPQPEAPAPPPVATTPVTDVILPTLPAGSEPALVTAPVAVPPAPPPADGAIAPPASQPASPPLGAPSG